MSTRTVHVTYAKPSRATTITRWIVGIVVVIAVLPYIGLGWDATLTIGYVALNRKCANGRCQ